MLRTTLLLALAALLASPAAQARIVLDADFDHGSLESWSGSLSSVHLVGRDNYYGNGKWRWLYFKASGVAGAQTQFSISRNFAGDSTPGLHELEEHEMVYSYDNQTWHFFDNNHLGPTNYTFSNSTPFTENNVYIAYALPYSYGRSVAHTQAVLASPWASPTLSGNSSGVVGHSQPGTDDIGRAVPALDVFGYRITNPATDGLEKHKVVIASGLHSGEPLGTWTYQGMVDWLLSADPRAAWVRDHVEVFGYPVLNPSGRYAGTNRTTVNNIGRDPNGLWDPSRWSSSNFGCGGGDCAEIRALGQAMMADSSTSPGGVALFVDFHSTVPDYVIDEVNGIPDDFAFISAADVDSPWWQELKKLQPNILEEESASGNFTTAGFARRLLDAEVEITFETQFTWERNTDYYLTLGKHFGLALYNAWAPDLPGDYNDDGQVDAADYTVWRNALGTAAALPNDDTPGVGIDDYVRWKEQYGSTAVDAASVAGTTQAIPEPRSVGLLLLFITAAGLSQRGRAKRGLSTFSTSNAPPTTRSTRKS